MTRADARAGEVDAPQPRTQRWAWAGLIVAVIGWFAAFALAPRAFRAIGANHLGVRFLDLQAILASNDALTAGLDPYRPNPLDIFHRPHVYSSWWLHLRDLGLTRGDTFAVGMIMVTAFLLAALGTLRPRSWREAVFYFFLIGSPPILLAVDRANNDLLVFLLLLPVVPCLFHSHRWVRLLPVLLIATATALKFYPVVAVLVLLLVGDAREIRIRLAITAAVIALVSVGVLRDLAVMGSLLPRADGLTTFGAINLPESIGLSGVAVRLAVGAAVVAVALVMVPARGFDAANSFGAVRRDVAWFALGAVLLTTCFFMGTNYAYRWVFALWMAPFLWRAPSDTGLPARVRQLARLLRILLLIAIWLDPMASAFLTVFVPVLDAATITALADRFFAWEQPITWLLFLGLLVFVMRFGYDAVRRVSGRS